jgi:biotin carboxyl carrier protein
MTEEAPRVTRVGDGVYRVETSTEKAGRAEIVYLSGPANDRWAFWNGHVFRADMTDTTAAVPGRGTSRRASAQSSITAPMPATVLKVHVAPGARVKKGETLVVLEAMKMELPLRATGEAVVGSVLCREGELVPADAVLVTFE